MTIRELTKEDVASLLINQKGGVSLFVRNYLTSEWELKDIHWVNFTKGSLNPFGTDGDTKSKMWCYAGVEVDSELDLILKNENLHQKIDNTIHVTMDDDLQELRNGQPEFDCMFIDSIGGYRKIYSNHITRDLIIKRRQVDGGKYYIESEVVIKLIEMILK